jgi:hypothetical protein
MQSTHEITKYSYNGAVLGAYMYMYRPYIPEGPAKVNAKTQMATQVGLSEW